MKRPKNRRQAERKAGALARQDERAKRSTEEQLMFLDDRPGEARRERERLRFPLVLS